MQTNTTTQEGSPSVVEDYSGTLKDLGLEFKLSPPYYQVGVPNTAQGWILHLSSIWTRMPELLDTVVPILKKYSVAFKVVLSQKVAASLCDGDFGYHQQGKVICIYPPTDEVAVTLVQELLEVTKDFSGCNIPTDFCLGGILYTRYGSFGLDIRMDQDGNIVRYIQNANGQQVPDEYHTPFKFPTGIPWPFSSIAKPVEQAPSTFLKDSYKIYSTLKADAKGRVMKSLRMQGLKVGWIVIKEAKQGVFVDPNGRDIRDRLHWQYELLSDLEQKTRVPKVYDYFTENGNAYLAMENIKGKTLELTVGKVFGSTTWRFLENHQRQLLIDDFSKLLRLVEAMHQNGYVHRDINTVNFLKNPKGVLVAIDLELAYSIKRNEPNPPFTVGTPGFISPEQQRTEQPSKNQDVYSLGATMIKCFANLNPLMYAHNHPDLHEDLHFFIQNERITNLIVSCLSKDPEKRPDVKDLISRLEEVRNSIDSHSQTLTEVSRQVAPVISRLINAFATRFFVDQNGIWFSKPPKDESLANQKTEISYSFGLYTGVSGPMYTLAKAKCLGHDIEIAKAVYAQNWKYIHDQFLPALPNVIPGLYHGAAGVAMTIAKGIQAGLIDLEYESRVWECLKIPNPLLDLSAGIAGQGVALLNCLEVVRREEANELLQSHISTLLQQQKREGSWLSHQLENGKPTCYTGIANGSAGICLFLLKCYRVNQNEEIKHSIERALKWLMDRSRKTKEGIFWRVNNRTKKVSLGLNEGTAGIALCFIKAYEILGNEVYRQTAERALMPYDRHFITENLTLTGGVTGLGMVYLEAKRVLKDKEWVERADFIINSLLHSARKADSYQYWVVDGGITQTADLMTGNAGILDLLLDYDSPENGLF